MLALTERDIRASLINASRKEVSVLSLPPKFSDIDFSSRDFLGWSDAKFARRAYVITEVDGVLTGALLQRAEQRVLARAQCSWCEDVTLRNDVQLFAARKAGAPGRKGDTVGTLTCAEFGCSHNVRQLPPLAYEGFDREAARDSRIERLGENVRAFLRTVSS